MFLQFCKILTLNMRRVCMISHSLTILAHIVICRIALNWFNRIIYFLFLLISPFTFSEHIKTEVRLVFLTGTSSDWCLCHLYIVLGSASSTIDLWLRSILWWLYCWIRFWTTNLIRNAPVSYTRLKRWLRFSQLLKMPWLRCFGLLMICYLLLKQHQSCCWYQLTAPVTYGIAHNILLFLRFTSCRLRHFP